MKSSSTKQKSDLLRLSFTLAIIAGIMALLVAFVNGITAPEIALQNEQKTESALKKVMPEADSFEEVEGCPASVKSADGKDVSVNGVWTALRGGEAIGVCVKVSPKGYGGAIETIVGINADGTVADAKIVSISETAGIGTKIQNDSFLTQFVGKSGSIIGTKDKPETNSQIQTISGATKSSKAYLRGINAALEIAKQVQGGEVSE